MSKNTEGPPCSGGFIKQFRIWIFSAAEYADFADLTLMYNLIIKKICVKSAKSAYSAANNCQIRNC
jgi:hypothetical protein